VKRPTDSERFETIIAPTRGWAALRLGELWEYRELLYFLTWRDIKVRYKQTALGAAWAILQPLMTMLVFTLVFRRLAGVPSDGLPYPLFAYAALLPWQLFARGLSESSNSLVAHQNLLTKVYFPRLLLPLSALLGGVVDFLIAFVILLGMMFYYGIAPTLALLALPAFLLLALTTAMAVGTWLAALNVEYRDVRYTLPLLSQLWLFATPIAYPSSMVPERFQALYGLNPMAGVVEGFRWSLLGQAGAGWSLLPVSTAVVALLLVTGLLYFRRMEREFADVV
jgi:lipopolysaccharide transport system permease protein